MRYKTIILLILMVLIANLGADVTELFSNYENYLNLKNIEKFENLFIKSVFFNNALDEKMNWINEIGEFHYSHEIVSINEINDSIVCYGLRKLEAPDQKELYDIAWVQWKIQKINNEYSIKSETLLNYLDLMDTELNVKIFPFENKLNGNLYVKLRILKEKITKVIFYSDVSVIPSQIKINNQITNFKKNENFIIIDLLENNKDNDIIDLQIGYVAQPSSGFFYLNADDGYSSWLGGWYPMLWGNNSFSSGAISISVPEELYAISNGSLQNVENKNGWNIFDYKILKPANFTIAYGKYKKYSKESDSLKFTVYLLKDNSEKAELYLNSSIEIVDFLRNEEYGFYPFDEYAIIEVSANYPGCSENGFTAIGTAWMKDNDFHFPTFAHEIGHLWWGNYIIGKGVLMSEGFAQYSYYRFMEKKYGEKIAKDYLNWGEWRYDQAKYKYFSQIEPDYKRNKTLASTSITNHTLANTKGLSVLVALRNTIGQATMNSGIRVAQKKFPHSLLTIDVFLDEIQSFTDIDLLKFRKNWIYTTNCPKITGSKNLIIDEKKVSGELELTNWDNNLDVELGLYSKDFEEIEKLTLKPGFNKIDLDLGFLIENIEIDPNQKLVVKTEEYQNLEHLGKAITAWYGGNYDLAVTEIKNQIEINPTSIISQIYAGKLLYHFAKDSDLAIKSFEYVLEQPETFIEFSQYLPTIYSTLSRIYLEQGDENRCSLFQKKAENLDSSL